ncbi:MAG: sulfotransferase [Planctomycetaceae bacterium]|nr:sulfotransferase [Planctomycetaceae bacterium]
MHQPIIIIGAARSGTNMLRDVLTLLKGVGTWPCDEINYIWRYGNASHPLDEFSVQQATPTTERYIRRQFDKMVRQLHVEHLVEKTCANSLRVEFVAKVIPDAKFVFITRDGRDVVPSAMKCWSNPINLGYIARKARFVPWRDVPYYGSRYLANRLYHTFSGKKRLAFWGPKFEGMNKCLQECTLAQVCATQWVRSVQRSVEAFESLDPNKVFPLRYEDFVGEPLESVRQVTEFLGINANTQQLTTAVAKVSNRSVGNWRRALDDETLSSIEPIVGNMLVELGYVDPPATIGFPNHQEPPEQAAA